MGIQMKTPPKIGDKIFLYEDDGSKTYSEVVDLFEGYVYCSNHLTYNYRRLAGVVRKKKKVCNINTENANSYKRNFVLVEDVEENKFYCPWCTDDSMPLTDLNKQNLLNAILELEKKLDLKNNDRSLAW
jgi:hypothetical protein